MFSDKCARKCCGAFVVGPRQALFFGWLGNKLNTFQRIPEQLVKCSVSYTVLLRILLCPCGTKESKFVKCSICT
eukprot:3703642-Amphidinium_carterae.1